MWRYFVDGLNEIHSNWFGFVILCIGVYVAMRGRTDVANPIIVGAFAIINSTSSKVTMSTDSNKTTTSSTTN